uniref:VLRF1 domain-containing protein n=1 Tax=Ananas comosus var. bracteatus TaxID=296719 RepID=A0A6V7PK13_ANACO|nr:unnamed protein product [Ananas comosus var. bracteatus]
MAASETASRAEKKPRSLFDLPPDFFDSGNNGEGPRELDPKREAKKGTEPSSSRWTCNACKAEFDSLQDQRSHFKSDLHRLNVKLSNAGKDTIKEEDFDELGCDSLFQDLEVSSISGSEDELENGPAPNWGSSGKGKEEFKRKLFFRLHSGDTVSLYRCLLLDESEDLLFNSNSSDHTGISGHMSYVEESELINRLKCLISEPRDKTHLRIILLTSGGHFAGCVFDGNSILAHKTFHRYVVRAKAGKKQSSKDATGKAAHSAGSSLRRYNEVALKKEIQDLVISWKPYFDSCSCAFLYAPSRNRQMLFDGGKAQLILQGCKICNIPLTVRRPTLKEVKRLYNHLIQMTYEVDYTASGEVLPSIAGGNSVQQSNDAKQGKHLQIEESISNPYSSVECKIQHSNNREQEKLLEIDDSSSRTVSNLECKYEATSQPSFESETTPLHEAAKSGDAQRTLELLEQGLNPCIRDERGRTPYMLATEKEVRNTFRRFMALNLDKWDWHAANVPSALTKEMEEFQAAKQAEKDARRKAKAKEMKKLKKEKEKAKAEASLSQSSHKLLHIARRLLRFQLLSSRSHNMYRPSPFQRRRKGKGH